MRDATGSVPRAHRGIQVLVAIIFVVPALLVIGFAMLYATPLSYFYCLARERAWLDAKTEADLDRRMFAFYAKRKIFPSESMWGRSYRLKSGERMTQYLVFAKDPLDVVFDERGNVVVAFTSYE